MRTNPSVKVLQAQGLGSRKNCQKIFLEMITNRNGSPFNPSTDLLKFGDTIILDGEPLVLYEHVYVLLHKPVGYETSHKPVSHPSVFELLPHHFVQRRIQAAGRLDVDTSGVLLLSDDGQFIHRMTGSAKSKQNPTEKEYWITTARPVHTHQIDQLLAGVTLHDEPQRVAAQSVEKTGPHQLKLVITSGKYHQVRRMIAAVGNHVQALHRNRVGPYTLTNLPAGQFELIEPTGQPD